MQPKNILLALPALAVAAPTPEAAPQDDFSVQIVGGSAATTGQFPYQVALLLNNGPYCGGTIINANTVITAAHCLDYPASQYTVRAGSLVSYSYTA